MKLGRLNHVGVATPDIEAAIAFWRDTMGATAITEPFDMPEQGVRVCFVDTPDGGTQIELLAPLSDASPIAAFLQRNPLGGQHHLAFEVPDIHAGASGVYRSSASASSARSASARTARRCSSSTRRTWPAC